MLDVNWMQPKEWKWQLCYETKGGDSGGRQFDCHKLDNQQSVPVALSWISGPVRICGLVALT